jgi:integrase
MGAMHTKRRLSFWWKLQRKSKSGKREPQRQAKQASVKGLILTYLVHLKNEGYREPTIMQKKQLLYRLLSLGADLRNPESVKKAIASIDKSESYKLLLCIAYEGFAKYHGIQGWTRPNYKQCEKLPFIPYEEEIDALISGSGRKTAAFLRLLKETGMRFGEAWRLKWTDIDFKNNIITCNSPEKGSRPRIFKVSSELIAMLGRLKKKSVYVFGGAGPHALKVSFMKQRKRLAYKLQNPRLMRISFHTIRHWKATMLYHETKDILYVMKFLGHKSIKNTLIYIDLERACFPKTEDNYHVRVAQTPEEITELLQAGFEYVLQKDGLAYFRKRK